MAFIAADFTTVDAAIRDVMAGKRVVSITLSDRIERRTDVTLDQLLRLREQIRGEIEAAETDLTKRRPRIFRARHGKGL